MRSKIRLNSILVIALLFSSCSTSPPINVLKPTITYTPTVHFIDSLPSAFPPLTEVESVQPWAKELILGDAFAREMDLYRALTCYKSALILLSNECNERRLQITYDIILAYYLGNKYQDAINTFEGSVLTHVTPLFPAFNNLLLILYDSYRQTGQCDKAEGLYETIGKASPETAQELSLYSAVKEGDICEAEKIIYCHPSYQELQAPFDAYFSTALSPKKARFLNAVLPGAGYYYVGQKKSAVTSFLINALFTAASYQLFDRGYTAGGLIVASLEMGWYFGGINGAGIEAEDFNSALYNSMGTKLLFDNKMFPVLMFETTF
jgi:tetratricopeptide (TPR) repeat protein